MDRPLRLRVAVYPDAQPVADALARLHVDLGSVRAGTLGVLPEGVADDDRFLCVALSDYDEVLAFSKRLRADLSEHLSPWEMLKAIKLTDRCLLHPLPLDAVLIVFLDIPAFDATPRQ